MGIVSRYIPYKELMIKMRYISKDWMLFTQKYLQFSNQEKVEIKNEETRYLRVAKVKIWVDKMYSGEEVVPILWHPYYSEAEEIDFYYEWLVDFSFDTDIMKNLSK